MSEIAVRASHVAKQYRIGRPDRHRTLRDAVTETIAKPFRRAALEGRPAGARRVATDDTFWALTDVSFDVERGAVMGVIGPNGAGKSTLLKLLSRITEPTRGRIAIHGRVGSLLEVGTGFHPELTGRENVSLNGAILGMRRAEIARKFDDIVAFAEVEKFIDTPVKHYSSGMYMRLAFSVAAHLEPEILVIDEVLAVGDAQFQKRCLGKMGEVAGSGRTVLFVSHNMAAVSSLCTETIYLRGGEVQRIGAPADCISMYLQESFPPDCAWSAATVTGHPLQILSTRLVDDNGSAVQMFEASTGGQIELRYEVREPISNAIVEVWVLTADGVHLMTLGEHDVEPELLERRQPGRYTVRVRVPGNLLNIGHYYLRLNSGIPHRTFDHVDALRLEVVESDKLTSRQNRRGHIIPLLPWERIT